MVTVDIDHPDIEDLHRLEGARGAEGGRPGRRLQARQTAPQRGHARPASSGEGDGDDGLRSPDRTPRCSARDRAPRRRPSCPRTTSSASSSSRARAIRHIEFPTFDTDWESEAYLIGVRPERQQLGPRHRRVPAGGRGRPASGRSTARTDRQDRQDGRARATCGTRSAEAAWPSADPGVQYDTTINDWHTCPEGGPHQRVQPVLGVHVPGRHGVQSGLAEPDAVPPRRRLDRRGRAASTPAACGRWCSRSR